MAGMADIVDDGICVDIKIVTCIYFRIRLADNSRELLFKPPKQAVKRTRFMSDIVANLVKKQEERTKGHP